MLALPGSSTISTASDANISCITFTKISSLPASFPSTFARFMSDDLNGMEERRKSSSRVLFFPLFFFFPLALRGGNEVLTEEDWYFKMVLICLYFSPLMLASPSPFPRFPHFYLNHTSNNDLEERTEREAALWRVSSSFEKKKNQCVRLAQVRAKVSSQMCTGDPCFWVKVLPLWICFKMGIASRSLGSDDERLAWYPA